MENLSAVKKQRCTIRISRCFDGKPWITTNVQSPEMGEYIDSLPIEWGASWRSDYGDKPEYIGVSVFPQTDENANVVVEKLKTFFPEIEKYFESHEKYLADCKREEEEFYQNRENKIQNFIKENPSRVKIITRRSKLGFGYSTQPTGRGTIIESVTAPNFIGTIKQIISKKKRDRTYQALRSCYMSTAWFVRIDGDWREIIKIPYGDLEDLIYSPDGITVFIE